MAPQGGTPLMKGEWERRVMVSGATTAPAGGVNPHNKTVTHDVMLHRVKECMALRYRVANGGL